MPTDWQELSFARTSPPAVVDPRRRLRCCVGAFVLLLLVVWCRAVQLEISQGATFREEALRPIRREKPLPAPRGRILARDGTLLACDREVAAVAVEYRYLEEPPRQSWLEQMARKRLPQDQRRNAARLAEEVEKVRRDRDALQHRLARCAASIFLSGRPGHASVQSRVERIAADARRRQLEAAPIVPAAPQRCIVGRSLLRRPCTRSSSPPAMPCRRQSPWPKNLPTMCWPKTFPRRR